MKTRPRLLLAAALALAAGLAVTAPARADRASRLVASLYQRYLDRYPDPSGMRDWSDKLRSGMDPVDVEAAILSSDEYWRRAGSTPTGWVDRLFRDTTGRPPAGREFRYWVDRASDNGDLQRAARDFLIQLHGDRPWY
jgi:hypothetical protein